MIAGRWMRARDCRQASRLSQSYADDETDPAQTLAMQAHLRDCARCSGELSGWRQLKDRLSRLAGPPSRGQVRRMEEFVDRLRRG